MGWRGVEEQVKWESSPASSQFHLWFLLVWVPSDDSNAGLYTFGLPVDLFQSHSIFSWIIINNVMGQGQVSNHSGTSWDPVITVNSCKVTVLIMFLLNYVTHQYTHATPKKSWRRSVISDCSFSYFFLRSTLLYDPTYSRWVLRLLWLRKCWRKTTEYRQILWANFVHTKRCTVGRSRPWAHGSARNTQGQSCKYSDEKVLLKLLLVHLFGIPVVGEQLRK